jgi:hypothetical protein
MMAETLSAALHGDTLNKPDSLGEAPTAPHPFARAEIK